MPKVLIIEDNDATLKLLRAALRQDPTWEVLFASDGERGLELATQHIQTLRAVILDVFLPRLDGRIVAERIRALAPALPIIGISGDADTLDEMKARGATHTLSKPLIGTRVAELLQALTNNSHIAVGQPRGNSDAERVSPDRRPILGMHALDLNIERVQMHIRTAVERRRYEGPTDWQEFLHEHGCIIEESAVLRPTLAGALAFASRPEAWIEESGVDVAEFSGTRPNATEVRLLRPFRGNIFSVIERTVDHLWARIDHTSSLHGVEQVPTSAYPHIVLRELTVNALCHRDWNLQGSLVRIQVFNDRIEWISPGGLPEGVKVTALRDTQVSRNRVLARLLYEAGVVERFGLGLDTVLDTLQEEGHPAPEMIDLGHSFIVRVFGKPISADLTATRKLPPSASLTQRQLRLLNILSSDEHSATDLAEAIGESKWTILRELNALVEQQLVVAVGAARARRYRRTTDM